jgi:hypothetical protein
VRFELGSIPIEAATKKPSNFKNLKAFDQYRRWDSNPHVLRHTPLKRACLPIPPLRHFSPWTEIYYFCAQDWTRTSTPAKALPPQSSASTNFATWAGTKSAFQRATKVKTFGYFHNPLTLSGRFSLKSLLLNRKSVVLHLLFIVFWAISRVFGRAIGIHRQPFDTNPQHVPRLNPPDQKSIHHIRI